MNILLVNPILYTVDNPRRWPQVASINDTMIYGMAINQARRALVT